MYDGTPVLDIKPYVEYKTDRFWDEDKKYSNYR
jgi:tRNA (Thr-GGU) A37 N-methylase